MTLDEQSDVELVKRFKHGNLDAFDALVRRFQNRVFRLACVWLHDAQQADDATQEVFLRSFKGLRAFRFRSAPFTWLYRTTKNVCRELNRKRLHEPLDEEPGDPSAAPERHAAEFETARQVRRLVSALPRRQREVVMLRVFEDLSVAETAAAMGCRDGTVKALLHKATKRLKLNLETIGLVP